MTLNNYIMGKIDITREINIDGEDISFVENGVVYKAVKSEDGGCDGCVFSPKGNQSICGRCIIGNTHYIFVKECNQSPQEEKHWSVPTRSFNVGESDYASHEIQPWDIIEEYGLGYFEGTVLSYLLREKGSTPEEVAANRKSDLKKIQHIISHLLEKM